VHEFRCDVPDEKELKRLIAAPLPLGLRPGRSERVFHRDIYLDTPDGALRRRDVGCRLRLRADDRRVLTLFLRDAAGGRERFDAEVVEVDPRRALDGATEPARRLRGLLDPTLLRPRIELETERVTRGAQAGFLLGARFELAYETITVRSGALARSFHELRVRRLRAGSPALDQIEKALALRTLLVTKKERAEQLLAGLESEALVRAVGSARAVAVLAVDNRRIALRLEGGVLTLPTAEGSGEEACRHVLKLVFGSSVADLRLLGSAPAVGQNPTVEVWTAERLRRDVAGALPVEWLPLEEVLARVGSPALRDAATLAALTVAARSDVFETGDRPAARPGEASGARPSQRPHTQLPCPVVSAAALDTRHDAPEQFINAELSLLDFNLRVLELAEDARVPLLSRAFFLSVVSANQDEVFMVRVGGLKQLIAEGKTDRGPDGLTPQELLDILRIRVRQLVSRQQSAARDILRGLVPKGVAVVAWSDLEEAEREPLRKRFKEQLFPLLSPRAITLSPGHPFPVIPGLTLCLAVVIQDFQTAPAHFATLRMPASTPRFVALPGEGHRLLPIEELVRANLALLYPDRHAAQAFLFRLTRLGDLDVDDEVAGDLLQAVKEGVESRGRSPVVRVELAKEMTAPFRELLLKELRLSGSPTLGEGDVYESTGLLDLGAFAELASLPLPELKYAPFTPRDPLPRDRPLWDQIRERDLLVQHPYDDFRSTVVRFFEEAAADPDVVAIKSTLYRVGDRSPIVDALLAAAQAGKDVAVFVELKARFDEGRNVAWVKRLEEAGAAVVYGIVGLKTHAKVTLVLRREGPGLARYTHVGTGNYNAGTARVYTDLGLFTADGELGADVNDLFNELMGASRSPRGPFRRLLVAPNTLLPGLLERIEREIGHAAAGRPARITAKLNGLSDGEMVRALYRASQAGVDVRLVIRGICVLRPGVPGLSDRIGVVSVLGRLLEHARVYRFENGGEPEVLIGSADWRPRNLRRRVEVAAPVTDAAHGAELGRLLDADWTDPTAWELGPHGAYLRRREPGIGAQEARIAETTARVLP